MSWIVQFVEKFLDRLMSEKCIDSVYVHETISK